MITKTYPEGKVSGREGARVSMIGRIRYAKTGEFRCPKRHERYLDERTNEVYMAKDDFHIPYHIMREVEEILEARRYKWKEYSVG